jgi:FixJ family two-component response regulator
METQRAIVDTGSLNISMYRNSFISVVDDDEFIRESLEGLMKSVGFDAATFPSAEAFLRSDAIERTGCLILDIRLGGMSGPKLRRKLIDAGRAIPTIFITAHGDESIRTRMVADGAVDCLLKPFTEEDLLAAVQRALRLNEPPSD